MHTDMRRSDSDAKRFPKFVPLEKIALSRTILLHSTRAAVKAENIKRKNDEIRFQRALFPIDTRAVSIHKEHAVDTVLQKQKEQIECA